MAIIMANNVDFPRNVILIWYIQDDKGSVPKVYGRNFFLVDFTLSITDVIRV